MSGLAIIAGTATRFLATPYGAEVTSPMWYDLDGWSYLMLVIQHPYGESDNDKVKETGNTGEGAYVGYVGPFRTADLKGAPFDFEGISVPRGDDRHKASSVQRLQGRHPVHACMLHPARLTQWCWQRSHAG